MAGYLSIELLLLPFFIAVAVEAACRNGPIISHADAVTAARASSAAYAKSLRVNGNVAGTPFRVKKIVKDNKMNLLVFVADSGNTRMISFRGTVGIGQLGSQFTKAIQDVIKDNNVFMVGRTRTRALSFVINGLNRLWGGLSPYLTDSSKRYIITGHSLGGALGSLLALKAKLKRPAVWKNPKSCLITFGAPRVGDHAFATTHDRLIPAAQKLRIVNRRDIVPHIPVSFNKNDNFEHHSRELWLSTKYLVGKQWFAFPQRVANKACGLRDPRNCRSKPLDCSNCLTVGSYRVWDHRITYYIKSLTQRTSTFYDKNGANKGNWNAAIGC